MADNFAQGIATTAAEGVAKQAGTPKDGELYGMTPEQYYALHKENAQKAYDSLSKQYDVAQKGVGTAQQGLADLATSEKGALGNVQNQSALAFLGQQGRGGGGSGAAMRQSMLGRGVAEGSVRGDFAQRRIAQEQAIQQAEANAAKAGADFATEREKLTKAAQADLAGATPGYDEAMAIYNNVAEQQTMFMTESDRQNAIAQIQRKLDAEPNPAKRQGMQQAINDIKNGKGTKGNWDTATAQNTHWYDPTSWF